MRASRFEQLGEIQTAVANLDPEARIRLRHWIAESFDGCGLARTSNVAVDNFQIFRVSDFERSNMREFQRLGRLKDRGLPPNCGGIYAIASDRDWLYVGKSKNLAARRVNHSSSLRHGGHSNSHLQRHWNVTNDPIWFIILERFAEPMQTRRGVEHPSELIWKRRLRPIYDREARRADISFFLRQANVGRATHRTAISRF